jgi:hypothetical protein
MTEDEARSRFLVMNAVRITGVGLVLVGILATRGVVPLPREVGYFFVVLGLIEVFVIPQLLARKWRSPPDSGAE